MHPRAYAVQEEPRLYWLWLGCLDGLCSSLRPFSLQRLKARRKTGEKCALLYLLVGRVFDNSQMLSDVMAVCGFARILGNRNLAQTVSKNTGKFFWVVVREDCFFGCPVFASLSESQTLLTFCFLFDTIVGDVR